MTMVGTGRGMSNGGSSRSDRILLPTPIGRVFEAGRSYDHGLRGTDVELYGALPPKRHLRIYLKGQSYEVFWCGDYAQPREDSGRLSAYQSLEQDALLRLADRIQERMSRRDGR